MLSVILYANFLLKKENDYARLYTKAETADNASLPLN